MYCGPEPLNQRKKESLSMFLVVVLFGVFGLAAIAGILVL